METKTKTKAKSNGHAGIKGKVGSWISKSPRFEKLIEQASYYFKHPEELNEKITEIYNKATNESGNHTVMEMWGKIMVLFRMIKASFKNQYQNVPKAKIILGTAVLLYFLMPQDAIPDFLPFIGFTDDMSLLLWFIRHANQEVTNFQQWESSHGVDTMSPAY